VLCVVYQFGIQLSDANSKILATFCARNERDRTKFVDDLKEAIAEVCRSAIVFTVVLQAVFSCINQSQGQDNSVEVGVTSLLSDAPSSGIVGVEM